ncbi:MAG: thermonuclease family protein [Pseudomonadota bacterium]
MTVPGLVPAGDVAGGYRTEMVGAPGCRVVTVVDGDTLNIACRTGGLQSVRLLGYDSPEIFSPTCWSEHWRGWRATWRLRYLLWSADNLVLEFTGEDRFDRRLARMRVNGLSVATHMIRAGDARAYDGGRRLGWCDNDGGRL